MRASYLGATVDPMIQSTASATRTEPATTVRSRIVPRCFPGPRSLGRLSEVIIRFRPPTERPGGSAHLGAGLAAHLVEDGTDFIRLFGVQGVRLEQVKD